jgi:hypothetical protein
MLLDATLLVSDKQSGLRTERRVNPISTAAAERPRMEFDDAIAVQGPFDENGNERAFVLILGDGRRFRCIHRGRKPSNPVPSRAVMVRGVPLQLWGPQPDNMVTFNVDDVQEVT